jgi:uncharacterized protein with HEPN domain
MKNTDIQIVEHIVKYCSLIASTINRFGDSFELFLNDFDYQQSISFSICQIGELTNHFSQNARKVFFETIPLAQIKGIRNKIVHGYLSIDLGIIWNTAIIRIPELQNFCTEILKNNQNQSSNHDDDPDSPRFKP